MPASKALFADIVEKKHNHIEITTTTESEVSGRQLTLLNTIKSGGWAVGLIFSNIFMNLFGAESLVLFLIITTILALIFALFVNFDHNKTVKYMLHFQGK